MAEHVFCKDCRWAKKSGFFTWNHARCTHPSCNGEQLLDVVTGKRKKENLTYCSIARDYQCKQGKFFDPRDKILQVMRKLDRV